MPLQWKKIKVETERQVFLGTLSIYLRACEKPILVMVKVFWPEEESSAYTVIWSHYYNMTNLKKKKKRQKENMSSPKTLSSALASSKDLWVVTLHRILTVPHAYSSSLPPTFSFARASYYLGSFCPCFWLYQSVYNLILNWKDHMVSSCTYYASWCDDWTSLLSTRALSLRFHAEKSI